MNRIPHTRIEAIRTFGKNETLMVAFKLQDLEFEIMLSWSQVYYKTKLPFSKLSTLAGSTMRVDFYEFGEKTNPKRICVQDRRIVRYFFIESPKEPTCLAHSIKDNNHQSAAKTLC